MKKFAFLLSIFIFTMAVMPCEDDIEGVAFKSEILSCFDGASHNHSQGKDDPCTVFCICQCSGTTITIPSSLIYTVINNTVLYSYSHYYTSLYSFDYSNGVWRPPILS